MHSKGIYHNYSSILNEAKLVKIRPNLVIALFELMKIIPAKYTIINAISNNRLDPAHPVVETSSGSYALGMGIVCAELKIPFIVISDPVIDRNLKNRLENLGGKVQIVSGAKHGQNVQIMRLNYLEEFLLKHKTSFWPSQYNNPENRYAYAPFAELLLKTIGKNFTLVGSVGSGGSTCGTIERLRMSNDQIKLVGVDTFGSILFGLPKQERKLRGLGNSIIPKNLIHEYYDQVHWVDEEIAISNIRKLHLSRGLFCGPTTGAAYHVANWIAENNKNEMVVVISPDSGYRYMNTAYNNDWLRSNYIAIDKFFDKSEEVSCLKNVKTPWSYYNWNRRSYKQVMDIQNGI